MEKPDKALLFTAALIGGYDLANPNETISSRINEYQEKPLGKYITRACIGYMALHLIGAIPEKYDPLSVFIQRFSRE